MIDFAHIIDTPNSDVKIFTGIVNNVLDSNRTYWQTWDKPKGIKWVCMIGAGGGGGGGTGINTSTTSGGGGGGGSGAVQTLIIPATMMPDTLFIFCGNGGLGASTSGAVGTAGDETLVSIFPHNTASAQTQAYFLKVGGGGGGGAATATAAGAAGSAGTVATVLNMLLTGRGMFQNIAGVVGALGGTSTTAGVNVTYPTTGCWTSGGAGGGGTGGATAFAGGSILGQGNQQFFPAVNGGAAATGATNAGNGSPGFNILQSLSMFNGTVFGGNSGGGGGGSTNNSGNAGAGGPGAPGCGGGGGGGMTATRPTIAKGGDGGPGFVIMVGF